MVLFDSLLCIFSSVYVSFFVRLWTNKKQEDLSRTENHHRRKWKVRSISVAALKFSSEQLFFRSLRFFSQNCFLFEIQVWFRKLNRFISSICFWERKKLNQRKSSFLDDKFRQRVFIVSRWKRKHAENQREHFRRIGVQVEKEKLGCIRFCRMKNQRKSFLFWNQNLGVNRLNYRRTLHRKIEFQCLGNFHSIQTRPETSSRRAFTGQTNRFQDTVAQMHAVLWTLEWLRLESRRSEFIGRTTLRKSRNYRSAF